MPVFLLGVLRGSVFGLGSFGEIRHSSPMELFSSVGMGRRLIALHLEKMGMLSVMSQND